MCLVTSSHVTTDKEKVKIGSDYEITQKMKTAHFGSRQSVEAQLFRTPAKAGRDLKI